MNTDLNDYPNDNYEKYSIHKVDDKSIVIIDDPEALQKDRIIQLIKKTHKDGKFLIYVLHPDKKQSYKINHRPLHDALKNIDPRFIYDDTYLSAETDLFRKIYIECFPAHIVNDTSTNFWQLAHNEPIAISPTHYKPKAQILNEFYQRLFKALSTDIDYKKAVKLRKEKSLNQNKKAKWLIRKLIIKFSKLLVIRIDFSINRNFQITLELLKAYMSTFLKKLHTPNDEIPSIVGYIWKLEYGIQKGYHYHFIFFMDGNIYWNHSFYADQLCKLWMSISQNKGYYYNCNNKMKSYKKLALGILVHDDHEKTETLYSVVDYITKADQFIIEKTLKNHRTFGYSTRKYEKSNAGRPRKINAGSISV
ncbi:YagK/YfjJ domain-containing protein [Acinetobacter nosocomialis]|uniref:YagK/YfjJ domain-containing protein n=1 Tax=Acinetobacter calcoaceticus/baumannii complex TaxID=909768 RepID=UPI001B8287DC|nr:inovirus-type Gp2 protein [Acinetobacter nosocomialis]MBR7680926.1 inovirus-type Gp2 protein [Acinetobacter nosocomialis]